MIATPSIRMQVDGFSAETGALTKTQHMAEPAPTDPHMPTVNRFQVSLSIDRRPQLTRICQRT